MQSVTELGGIDSWNMVKDYLQDEGTTSISQHNEDEDELSDEDDLSYDDQEEYLSDESEEEEDYDEDEDEDEEDSDEEDSDDIDQIYSEYDIHQMEKGEPVGIQQSEPVVLESPELILSPPVEPSTPVIPVPEFTPGPTQTVEQPVLQTQSPPVTPDQPPHPRKRNFIEIEITPVVPVATTTSLPVPLTEESIQTNKRRRIDDPDTGAQGWLGIAKTVGKYTVAGAIGGAATFLGLLWSAQQ